MNENTTLREIKQNLRNSRKIMNDVLEAGLGIGLEELIRKGLLNEQSADADTGETKDSAQQLRRHDDA